VIESALGWIGQLAEFFGSLVPRLLVVQSSHRAVKYKNGHTPVLLSAGRHLYWPLMSPIEMCAVVRQVLNMPTQLLETADAVPVAVGAVTEYDIVDPIAFLAETENGYEAIATVSTACVREVVTRTDYDAVATGGAELDRRLTRAIRAGLRRYGVRVSRARLSDFAKVRPIHLTGGLSAQAVVQRLE
jgi:regulator of protease activity HflC (stomatin/prohibitin superfamily)